MNTIRTLILEDDLETLAILLKLNKFYGLNFRSFLQKNHPFIKISEARGRFGYQENFEGQAVPAS